MYPDREHLSVRSSIRFETMRSGIEDYEMLRELERRDPAAAKEIGAKRHFVLQHYLRDVEAFRKIELRLLEALSRN